MARKKTSPLDKINRRLLRMARQVTTTVEQSISALVEQNEKLAGQVIANEDAIDRAEVRIEQVCVELLTDGSAHAPEDVRQLLSTIRVVGDLERIGDCAVNIAERLARFVRLEAPVLPPDLRIMANSAYGLLRDSLKCWITGDVEQSRLVLRADDVVDALYEQLALDLSGRLASRDRPEHTARYLDYLIAARNYERIADHATNIAESVIFRVTGEIVRHEASIISVEPPGSA